VKGLVAILCSGQGGQHPGMFDLVAEAPEAGPVFAAATAVLGQDPRRFVRESEPAALFSDRYGQFLCCTRALAAWAALGSARPARAVIAGYSVGELASWGCGGMFDAATTLDLARQRAEAMDAAAPKDGGLVGILGLTRSSMEALLSGREAYVAIINGIDSFVIGGHRSALEDICREALAQGARHVVMLPVYVPSHTPLLVKASVKLAEILAKAVPKMPGPGYRVLTGIDGDTVWDVQNAIRKLALQVSSTVHWSDCVDSCRAAGADTALELGPGRALSRMVADRFPAGAVRAVEDFKTLAGLRCWLQRAYDT
jgi:[acyl-carrier-protein] S-malonyltransferase